MTREKFTEIVCVLDRSGSMMGMVDRTIEGYNKFIKDQKKIDQDARVSLILFDDEYEPVYLNKDLEQVEYLTRDTYFARGTTALYDAVGKAITDVGTKLAHMHESKRPSKVIFVITTDGYENASKEYTREKIFDMINHQQTKYSWEFLFLAANQDAFATATSMGISAPGVSVYQNTRGGVAKLFNSVSSYVTCAVTDTGKGVTLQDTYTSASEELE